MAGTVTPIFPQTVQNWAVQILPADTTTLKTIATGATNGTKVEMINVTSTDTSARDVSLYWTISATNYVIGTVSIPITAGNTNSAPSVNLLSNAQIPNLQRDSNGNPYLYVKSGTTLAIASLTTVTTAKAIQVTSQGGDF